MRSSKNQASAKSQWLRAKGQRRNGCGTRSNDCL